jgi:hypothetical protein
MMDLHNLDLHSVPALVTAIGGLGTAAFGLVDASKVLPFGGVNFIGFSGIRKTVSALTPVGSGNALSPDKIIATLKANWFNGTDLPSQKAIAKSLIKLNLNPGNAEALAAATGVDPGVLTTVATKITTGTPLTSPETDVYARFDLIVTALLDETYQHSDSSYRNWTRTIAAIVAVVLAVAGGHAISGDGKIWVYVLVGLLATPLAPIAKDLSTALATAVNAFQVAKK